MVGSDQILEKETPPPLSSKTHSQVHLDHFDIVLDVIEVVLLQPLHISCLMWRPSKVVNGFQRWSADFLFYLPAFIEKKSNSSFLHKNRGCIVH